MQNCVCLLLLMSSSVVFAQNKEGLPQLSAPKPATDLKPATYHYDTKIAMGGQQMAIKQTTTVEEKDGMWIATDSVAMPTGVFTDSAVLNKGTLLMNKREVKQGTSNITVDFQGNIATGVMDVNGQHRDLKFETGGPLFADGPGLKPSLGCLPLADGYSVTYRSFDVQKEKAKVMQLKVAGSESVQVPAGSFDAWKVEISSAEGGPDKSTVWIAKDSGKPVKSTSIVAEMGGATMTSELMP
jgi:hypothetical protein